MKTEIGEQIVGAYLKIIKKCDYVNYNVRPTVGGIEGLGELDVIGFNYDEDTVYICEVITHIRGVLYGTYENTIQKIKDKHERQKDYADKYLKKFSKKIYQFWSPVVPEGKLTEELSKITGVEFIINKTYTVNVDLLIEKAKDRTDDTGNDVFRLFQILGVLKR